MKNKFAAAKMLFSALLSSILHPIKAMHMMRMAAAITNDIVSDKQNASRGYYSRKCRRSKIFKRLMSNGMVKEAQRYAV